MAVTMRRNGLLLTVLMPVVLMLLYCTDAPIAGGSDNPDFIVVGAVVDTDGAPAGNAIVTIVTDTYNPVADTSTALAGILTDTTDDNGRYELAVTDKGNYAISAVHLKERTRLFKSGIVVATDTTLVDAASLTAPGVVAVSLASIGNTAAGGYVYIPGSDIYTAVDSAADVVILDSIPEGMLPVLSLAPPDGAASIELRYDVPVVAGDTTMVLNPGWRYFRPLVLNTTTEGADVAGTVTDFPVLVRFNGDNFDFSEALPDGEDIEFTGRDGTSLTREIERWDPVGELAEVWVRVDTIFGDDGMQSIGLYWGNDLQTDHSQNTSVFNASAGFTGVWHLAVPDGETVPDATGNGNNGSAVNTESVTGVIGPAQSFDGATSLVRVAAPSDSILNFLENDTFSVSAWVKTGLQDTLYQGIVYKSNFQYGLQIRPEEQWEFFTFVEGEGWQGSRFPLSVGTWHYLAGVRHGMRQYLYLDGQCVDSGIVTKESDLTRAYNVGLEIGHCPDGGLEPDRYFNGSIDEVRICRVAKSADWIRLCYMNQKEEDALLRW
ncbi:MAG: DUF2341 domain-containing protein [Chitinispirillaceae bacterium]|nr:DUF2341 domain-containing protein [Chitinispirillaceae bacterium]